MVKPFVVILDFSASKVFTHHWKSIETFCNLLVVESYDFKVFIPKYAEKSLFTNRINVERKLISTDFGPKFSEAPVLKIANELINRFLSKLPVAMKLKVRQLLLSIYTREINRIIVNLSATHEKVIVLVPSAEPLSIFLFLDLHNRNIPNLEWRLRLIGSQERGLLGAGNETELLQDAINRNSKGVQVGYETFPYLEFLHQNGFNKKSLHWSPFPSEEMKLSHEPQAILRLGFLGSAKERKGFESIPSIVEAITTHYSQIEFLVQEAAYPWEGYAEPHQYLSINKHVKLLSGELSDEELTKFISSCDLIVLPYDPDSYALAASAILYHAADLHVPVMCPEGVGFAEEIEKYNIGLVYKDFSAYSDFPGTLRKIMEIKETDYIRYNKARDDKNRNFLFN
jgi:glycosyltransferase involved in cell wall biosynthesis